MGGGKQAALAFLLSSSCSNVGVLGSGGEGVYADEQRSHPKLTDHGDVVIGAADGSESSR